MSDTTMSLNEQVMRALHPTWVKMGGYFNDGEGRGYVTPDFEHSVDASLAVLPEHMAIDFRATQDGKPLGFYRVSLMDWTIMGGRAWKWDNEGATRAEALARALLAWAQRQEG